MARLLTTGWWLVGGGNSGKKFGNSTSWQLTQLNPQTSSLLIRIICCISNHFVLCLRIAKYLNLWLVKESSIPFQTYILHNQFWSETFILTKGQVGCAILHLHLFWLLDQFSLWMQQEVLSQVLQQFCNFNKDYWIIRARNRVCTIKGVFSANARKGRKWHDMILPVMPFIVYTGSDQQTSLTLIMSIIPGTQNSRNCQLEIETSKNCKKRDSG